MSACSQCGEYNCDIPYPHSAAIYEILEGKDAEIARLTEALKNWTYKEFCECDCPSHLDQHGKLTVNPKSELQAENSRLRDALKFYENVENLHRYKDGKRIHGHTDMPNSFAVMDYGKRAKEALASPPKEEKPI